MPKISKEALAWFAGRKISQATLERMNVASGSAFFPDAGAKLPAIFFKFREGWKARSVGEKFFVAGGGFKLSFWNLDAVLQDGSKEIFITEGETDALALVEAGIPNEQVLSVPNGSRGRKIEEPDEQRGYEFVFDALKEGLNKTTKVVWVGDMDEAGLALRADMARLFGEGKFWFVEFPEGAKDANDYLCSDGPEALKDLVLNGALQWPVAGLYKLSELPEPPPLVTWHPGFAEWESKVMIAPRTISVVTGHPNHGKTALWQQIWFQIVRGYSLPIAMASFETRAKPHVRRQIRTLFSGKLEKHMSDDEKRLADAWINDRYFFMAHPDAQPTLKWFLHMAEVAVVRHGVRAIMLDPWNRLEASRPDRESETDYIGRCLRELSNFAHDLNCHVQILAHPAKMDAARKGYAPSLEDISGSKNWENMVDQGFVVHRPEMFDGVNRKTEAILFHRKARFEELGYPCSLKMDYSLEKGSYRSIDYEVGGYTSPSEKLTSKPENGVKGVSDDDQPDD